MPRRVLLGVVVNDTRILCCPCGSCLCVAAEARIQNGVPRAAELEGVDLIPLPISLELRHAKTAGQTIAELIYPIKGQIHGPHDPVHDPAQGPFLV